jgi:homoprotocatechuate degradation regulator HpaR
MGKSSADSDTDVELRGFSQSLPMMLLLAREAVLSRFRIYLREFDITEQQWRVLRAVHSHPNKEITELAVLTALHQPSLSRILRDLQARNLLQRRQTPNDMRRALITLTAKGANIVRSVTPPFENIYAEMSAAYGGRRLEELQTLLTELTNTLNALPPPELDARLKAGATD